MHRFLCVLCITALAAAREKPTSRASRRARKAWLNGTKPPTLNTFYFYVDRDDPRNTTVPASITTMIARAQRDARRWGVDIRAEVHGFVSGRELVRQVDPVAAWLWDRVNTEFVTVQSCVEIKQ